MKATVYKQYRNGKPLKKPVAISGDLEVMNGMAFVAGQALLRDCRLVLLSKSQLVVAGLEESGGALVYQEWVCEIKT